MCAPSRGGVDSSGFGSETTTLRRPVTIVSCSPASSGRVARNVAVPGVNVASQRSVEPCRPWKQATCVTPLAGTSTPTDVDRMRTGQLSPVAFQ